MPHNDRDEYQRQRALELSARVMWCRRENAHHLCGVEFARRTVEQERALKACFDHFNKRPYYADGKPDAGRNPA
jgi:hypothetical protein